MPDPSQSALLVGQSGSNLLGYGRDLPGACQHCSGRYNAVFHAGPCPRVKAIEYHSNGTVKRVEFHDA